MQKQATTIAIITLLLGFGFGYVTGKSKVPSVTIDHSSMSMSDTMSSMNAELKGKSGDDFDTAFLSEMIVHHEGAVEMAELALTNAKHKEVKDLATAIISAQNTEIGQMKDWQKNWYGR
jgi:uncharacterized protein (DUF305 family)